MLRIAAALLTIVLAADLHEQVTATYGFRPRDLDEAQLDAKSAELDRFWQTVKDLGAPGLEQLRAELRREDASPFFSYDGAKLLLSLSQEPADLKLAVSSIARTELRDVQPGDYFYTLHDLSIKGQDTTAAAFRIFTDPEFQVIVPQHALTLNATSALMYILLPLDESVYVPATIARLSAESDPAAQRALLSVLAFAVDLRADEVLRKFAVDPGKDAESRALAAKIVESLPPANAVAPSSELTRLRNRRKKELANVSDEAMYEVQRLTTEMRRIAQPPK